MFSLLKDWEFNSEPFHLSLCSSTCTSTWATEIKNGLLSLNTNQRMILGRRAWKIKSTSRPGMWQKRRIEGGREALQLLVEKSVEKPLPLWRHIRSSLEVCYSAAHVFKMGRFLLSLFSCMSMDLLPRWSVFFQPPRDRCVFSVTGEASLILSLHLLPSLEISLFK